MKTYKPFKHQKMMIDHIIDHEYAAVFAGMGLGKSAATLYAYKKLKKSGKVRGMLIVAPLRVSVITWLDEVEQWFPELEIYSLRTKEGIKAFNDGKECIYTINYESIPKVCNNLFKNKKKLPCDMLILDELDNAKNPSSKRIRELRKHNHKFKRRVGLTGTPVSNNYLDLFAQIRVLDEGKLWGKVFGHWRSRFFVEDNPYAPYPNYVLAPNAVGILERDISDMAIVLSSEEYLKIPPTRTIDIDISLPPPAMKIYRGLEKELLVSLDQGMEIVAVNAAVLVNKLRQVTGGAIYATDEDKPSQRSVTLIHDKKIKALKALMKKHKDENILVFCDFIHERDRILKEIPQAESLKKDSIKRWNNNEIKMLVAHPKSIGHGINAQFGGRIVCWFSMGYSRSLYDQSNARLCRFGQTKETIIYRLLAKGLVDDAVVAALESKDSDSKTFLNTIKNIRRLKKV